MKRQTTVGVIDAGVLAFTAGEDVVLDRVLVEADCLGSAAHVTMLSGLNLRPRLFTARDRRRVIDALVAIMRQAAAGRFRIELADQDVHLAVERRLTERLGALGKRIHTARSRNDQVAVDLRLYAREQLAGVIAGAAELAGALVRFGRAHAADPMVGRTHMQPAMPSSVGLWATAHAESLLDDLALLLNAYELNNQCPLGAAAGYGVPLPIDRQRVSDLLGFSRPIHNVLYAAGARGKIEAIVLEALGQAMLTLSRLAQDLVLFTMPEFRYFTLPEEYATGSSIMPQKRNPDVLELVRARAARVLADAQAVREILRAAPSGYNRDVQETKEPFLRGFATTRASLAVMRAMVAGLRVNREALLAGFTPEVFATDYALELVGRGMAFRDAYHEVKKRLAELRQADPFAAIARKTHLGATAGLDFAGLQRRAAEAAGMIRDEQRACHRALSRLLGVPYPLA